MNKHDIAILIMRLEDKGYWDVTPKEHKGDGVYSVDFAEGGSFSSVWYSGLFQVKDDLVTEISREETACS